MPSRFATGDFVRDMAPEVQPDDGYRDGFH